MSVQETCFARMSSVLHCHNVKLVQVNDRIWLCEAQCDSNVVVIVVGPAYVLLQGLCMGTSVGTNLIVEYDVTLNSHTNQPTRCSSMGHPMSKCLQACTLATGYRLQVPYVRLQPEIKHKACLA